MPVFAHRRQFFIKGMEFIIFCALLGFAAPALAEETVIPPETQVSSTGEDIGEMYEQAIRLYQSRQYYQAEQKFKQVNERQPGYKATDSFLKRMRQIIEYKKDQQAKEDAEHQEKQAKTRQEERVRKERVEKRLKEAQHLTKEETERQQEAERKKTERLLQEHRRRNRELEKKELLAEKEALRKQKELEREKARLKKERDTALEEAEQRKAEEIKKLSELSNVDVTVPEMAPMSPEEKLQRQKAELDEKKRQEQLVREKERLDRERKEFDRKAQINEVKKLYRDMTASYKAGQYVHMQDQMTVLEKMLQAPMIDQGYQKKMRVKLEKFRQKWEAVEDKVRLQEEQRREQAMREEMTRHLEASREKDPSGPAGSAAAVPAAREQSPSAPVLAAPVEVMPVKVSDGKKTAPENQALKKRFDAALNRLYEDGVELYRVGAHPQARKVLNEVDKLSPGYRQVRYYLELIDLTIGEAKPVEVQNRTVQLKIKPIRAKVIDDAMDHVEKPEGGSP